MIALTPDEANAFHFQARFKLAPSQHILSPEAELVLTETGRKPIVYLHSHDEKALEECEDFILKGLCHESEVDARQNGFKYINAIKHVALQCGIGINLARDLQIWRGIRASIELGASFEGELLTGVDGPRFVTSLHAALAQTDGPDPELSSLIDILLRSHFDASERSRLLLATAVVELAFPRRERSPEIVAAIDELKHFIKKHYDENVKKTLLNMLGNTKRMTVGESYKEGLEKYLGSEAARSFTVLYNVRSKVAHEALSETELTGKALEAVELARRLLLAMSKDR